MRGQLVATVAADINACVLGDAKVHVRYRTEGDAERTVDTIKVPWRADQDQVAETLAGYGYAVGYWDLIHEDGYVLTANLALQMRATGGPHGCGGRLVCVQSRLEAESPQQLTLKTKHLCLGCGQVIDTVGNGG